MILISVYNYRAHKFYPSFQLWSIYWIVRVKGHKPCFFIGNNSTWFPWKTWHDQLFQWKVLQANSQRKGGIIAFYLQKKIPGMNPCSTTKWKCLQILAWFLRSAASPEKKAMPLFFFLFVLGKHGTGSSRETRICHFTQIAWNCQITQIGPKRDENKCSIIKYIFKMLGQYECL